MKILHFSDAHIDHSQHGKMNTDRGLHQRVVDFEKSLITIVDTAISENIELVLFSGDAYKDRSPRPTYQKLFETQIYRLSSAKIPTILLTGNHDMPKSPRFAHALQEFETLRPPYIYVISSLVELREADLGLPIQVIGVPWIYRDRFKSMVQKDYDPKADIDEEIENHITRFINQSIENADPKVPLILMAHTTVTGARTGDEVGLTLNNELKLSGALVKDERLDYVALGHIHKAQNLNGDNPEDSNSTNHPPVIYPGSIERLDFGERADRKYFVTADVQKGKTKIQWRELTGIRPFYNISITIDHPQDIRIAILDKLPPSDALSEAYLKVNLTFPAELKNSIDEVAIREIGEKAFHFQFNAFPQYGTRSRLGSSEEIGRMTDIELLQKYLETKSDGNFPNDPELIRLAKEIMAKNNEEIN